MRALLLLLLSIAFAVPALAQPTAFWLEGTVHGYEWDPGRGGLLKKNKPAVFEGTLDGVRISLYQNEHLVEEVLTDDKGNYSLPLDFNKLYTLIITKEGYNKNTLLIDTRALPKNIQQGGYRFASAEFVANSFKKGRDKSLDRTLGRLYYNPSQQQFILAPTDNKSITGSSAGANTADAALELLDKALQKNNAAIANYRPERARNASPKRTTQLPTTAVPATDPTSSTDSLSQVTEDRLTISRKIDLGPSIESSIADTSVISTKQEALQQAKEQLAIDKLLQQTKFDSLEILKREAQIQAAEQEIQNARLLIQTQQDKLQAQRNSLILLVLLLMLLMGFLYLVYSYYQNKQLNNTILEQKNKQITDSINYAQRIQQSILVGERTLKSHLCDSFVLSQPRDIVSGDFYFFHPHPNGYLLAVADCTGHGVPGAFMSLIGHRLLREIVAEKGVTDPARILDLLDTQVQEVLQGEKEGDILQDGMDISVCLIDPANSTITFAAAMNPAYLINGSSLQVLQADINSIGGKVLRNGRKRNFTNKATAYSKGSMLYLFSDGYMDQFGEEQDQKFNTRRFKDMLMQMQTLPAESQKEMADQTLKSWQGKIRQTDDIMLLGIRLP
ncbi:SpoIIE family protein phosphatase [Cesiribacter sp. SM1]|uniref:SpoIIE family protein phosphatase n=1 Tax=Cesiribacter sp. SM1 TaxID=2861196 RepID=UPI001CD44230|nr:SpoIIE family protein phosphatase [Cesiribacter sp. SM1]